MKKKVTITLLAGFVALISGLIICGIGYFMGGIEDIQAIATPNLTEHTYQDIREIRVDSQAREVVLDESPDDKFHVRYANFNNFRHRSLSLQEDNHTLTIQGNAPKFHIQGIMQFLGQELALNMPRNHKLSDLTILVPKGKTIDKLSGWNYAEALTLNNVRIKNLDWSSFIGINGDNVTLDGGTVNISSHGAISFRNSHLKNMTIDSPSTSQYYYTSMLENVKIQQASSVGLIHATILGTTSIESSALYHPTINVSLSDKSKKDTQLDVTVTYDWKKLQEAYYYPDYSSHSETGEEDEAAKDQEEEFQKEHLAQMGIKAGPDYKDLKIEASKDGAKLTHAPQDATNKLIIKTTNGKVRLGTLTD